MLSVVRYETTASKVMYYVLVRWWYIFHTINSIHPIFLLETRRLLFLEIVSDVLQEEKG